MRLTGGDTIDRYSIVSRLGEGGQAMVFRARDRLDGREVALKLVSTAGARPASIERARREGAMLSALRHPSIVRCSRAFEDYERRIFGLELELVRGVSLGEAMRGGHLHAAGRRWVIRHLASALAYLHREGLIHRDLKPDNVLLDEVFWVSPSRPDAVRLVDLGIASPEGNPAPLTNAGAVIGTGPYLAPELLAPSLFGGADQAGKSAPTRDVFAFGVLAHELLEHRHPTGLPETATLAQLANAYTAARTARAFPAVADASPYALLLRGALALHPRARIPDGTALLAALPEAPSTVEVPVPRTVAPAPRAPTASMNHVLAAPAQRRPIRAALGALLSIGVIGGLAALAYTLSPEPTAESAPGGIASARAAGPPPTTPPVACVVPLKPEPAPPQTEDGDYVREGALMMRRRRVTVEAFMKGCGGHCRGGAEAQWPGPTATPAALAGQTARCPFQAGRPPRLSTPVTCVTLKEAEAFCRAEGARVPTYDELTGAKAIEDRPGCTDPSAIATCAFEWSSTDHGEGFRATYNPSRRSTNPASASNADLGFRCVREP